jgi:hypothetical protein
MQEHAAVLITGQLPQVRFFFITRCVQASECGGLCQAQLPGSPTWVLARKLKRIRMYHNWSVAEIMRSSIAYRARSHREVKQRRAGLHMIGRTPALCASACELACCGVDGVATGVPAAFANISVRCVSSGTFTDLKGLNAFSHAVSYPASPAPCRGTRLRRDQLSDTGLSAERASVFFYRHTVVFNYIAP